MTDTKWTPGEWYAPKPEDNPSAIKSDQGHRAIYVADVLDPRDRPLIAAAPDLYDALLYAQALLASQDMGHDDIDNALAKARGDA